jgi:hypothetical protein
MTLSDCSHQVLACKRSPHMVAETKDQFADFVRRSVRDAVAAARPPDRVWRRIERALQDPQASVVGQLARRIHTE